MKIYVKLYMQHVQKWRKLDKKKSKLLTDGSKRWWSLYRDITRFNICKKRTRGKGKEENEIKSSGS